MVVNRGVKPEQLLVATFTEKAAKEVISRVAQLLMLVKVTYYDSFLSLIVICSF